MNESFTVHSHASEKRAAGFIRQLVFGLGHGLISILGLSIGVASATGSVRSVMIAGVVSMITGLATLVSLQFLSAKTQKEIYLHMIEEERREFAEDPEIEKKEMKDYYLKEGFNAEESDLFVSRLSADKERWLRAHVTHVLEFLPNRTGNPVTESMILGAFQVVGSIITLFPYLLIPNVSTAIFVSTVLTGLTLFAIGAFKASITGKKWYMSALEFFALGMLALIAGYLAGVLLKSF